MILYSVVVRTPFLHGAKYLPIEVNGEKYNYDINILTTRNKFYIKLIRYFYKNGIYKSEIIGHYFSLELAESLQELLQYGMNIKSEICNIEYEYK